MHQHAAAPGDLNTALDLRAAVEDLLKRTARLQRILDGELPAAMLRHPSMGLRVAVERVLAASEERVLAASEERVLAASEERVLAASEERVLAASDERVLAAS